MSTRFPRRRGFARVEFLACKPEVQAMLEQGHSYRSIYDRFAAMGRITMSYKNFCAYVSGRRSTGARVRRKTAVPQVLVPAVMPPALPALMPQTDLAALPADTEAKSGTNEKDDGEWNPKKFNYNPNED